MGGQVEVRFRVGFSPLSQSDLRVFGPFELLVGNALLGVRRRGSRGQRRVTYQRTCLIKPRPAIAIAQPLR
jgi:hypothetical protein